MNGFVMLIIVALLFLGKGSAEVPEAIRDQMRRVGEEAEVFASLAPRIIGEEKLEQVALEPPPRFVRRGEPTPVKYRTRHIVSEYSFTSLKQDGNLHEIRQVLTVDGKRVKAPGKLRETLVMGQKGDVDRMKLNLLKEFQSFGLREAALDFGQLILMFMPRQQGNFRYNVLRNEYLGAENVMVVAYEQTNGDAAMTVFEGRQVKRHTMRGELWLRASDGVPLRITIDTEQENKSFVVRHSARVDYSVNAFGCLMPAIVTYAEKAEEWSGPTTMLVENRFQYGNYKMFGASSDVKFVTIDDPVEPVGNAPAANAPVKKK